MHWQQVEDYLKTDDRAVLPLGCTEQHAYLSLATDSILAERIALEAAEPLGVPVFPVLPYGITPGFTAYPGTISLRSETYGRILADILGSLTAQGFRRILLVNGHGGNAPANAFAQEWMQDHPNTVVRLHNWWNAPKTAAEVQRIDPVASHASWIENFPWTRLEGVSQPSQQKPLVDFDRLRAQSPAAQRAYLGDGNFGGYYQRSDEDMLAVWRAGVQETRAMIEGPWA
jgi:creatinine amidohydrolase